MKKFKNSISVKAERHHLEAFAKDLEALGYLKSVNSIKISNRLVTNFNDEGNQYYGLSVGNKEKDFSFTLLSQWQEALLKASEVEQEEFKDGDWIVFEDFGRLNSDSFTIGTPYCLRGNSFTFENDDSGDQNGWSSLTVYEAAKEMGAKIRKATPEEIKSHLLKLAKDKGFDIGVKVMQKEDHTILGKITGFEFGYIGNSKCSSNKLQVRYGDWLVCDIDYLEIVPSHPSITINGYKAEFKEWGISFNGCAKIDKKIFIDLNDLIYEGVGGGNKSITSVKIGSGEFTSKQIKEIAEYYNK